MKRKCDRSGSCCAAFGAGLLIALICPVKLVLILEAVTLVLVGISLIKKT